MQRIHNRIRQATSTSKGKIIFFSLLVIILAGIAGGFLYWQTYKKQIIREQLEAAINGKSGGLYSIRYAALDLDEISGYLSVKEMNITYDSLRYESLRQQKNAPAILLSIHIPEIKVLGVKTPKALLDKEIEGTRLEIRNPELEIAYTLQGKDSSRSVPDREIYEQVLGNLNLIKMDTVIIIGGHIRTINMQTKERGIEFSNASIMLTGVQVDSAANADTSRILFAKQVMASCEEGICLSANKMYNYKMQGISFNSTDRSVSVKSFHLDPRFNEAAFMKELPAQEDRFDFAIQDIVIRNLDFAKLANEDISADSIVIGSASFKIYRDLNKIRDTKNRVGSYPHQAFQKIPIPISIKKILLRNGFVEYKEKNKITKETGKVQFYSIHALISNLTNKDDLIAKNNKMTASINCRFMDRAPFDVLWTFYLQNPNGRFDVAGRLGSINAKDISVLTEPMGPARIEDGTVNSVDFNLMGNSYSMNGTVKLLYENLKVALLERDEGSKEMDKKGLTSFIANFIIKNANPPGKNKETRIADVTYTRDTNRSIFNLTWKTLFKGLKQTVGINK